MVERSAAYVDRTPRGQVTTLPAEVEERTAELFRRWCMLDTIDALLVLHVCNGGTPKSFGDYLVRVSAAIEKLRPTRTNFRSTAWTKFKALVARFAGFDKVRTWNDGHGGGIRMEREKLERRNRQGLFDFMDTRK